MKENDNTDWTDKNKTNFHYIEAHKIITVDTERTNIQDTTGKSHEMYISPLPL